MAERILSNVKEKLSGSRIICPGLCEEVYALTNYMAEVANDELTPLGMALLFALSMEDIRNGENGFACAQAKEIPEYITKHKTQVLAQAVYVPQVIDAMADEDFANEFREICKKFLQFDPPKRYEKYNQNADLEEDYPEYVKVAVNWWANAITNPKFDNGDDSADGGIAFCLAMMVSSNNSITKEQIAIFKNELAMQIIDQIQSSHWGECILEVDYHPCRQLYMAAKEAEIKNSMIFPWKTGMTISKEKVSVSAGYGADWTTLWEKA